ncbi:hypothetical protein LTH96_02070 [Nesterenkonia sp. LB17]|uniref:hypothetical protein n=1 Tax=unclassified Nesterenkonia TaxID=2629769 RepID=UPI001F4C7872|nr:MULTISPECIES: hypothetical protein [unclassified Nesterenkonia]MCH8559770.1 hypothetical protein [Nesterenkonia sp. DZ6]MCH8561934.1 hypothetical protein [Nesterenkonia sp. YGD6]MCH8564529.1 hypothetical protein [Nesterenkonia sp. LB17]MCH8570155.1 hypothetical protein [Nesterenkonia sp. AY15]
MTAPQDTATPSRRSSLRPALLGVCFSAGVVLGILGTVLHGNILMLGPTETGTVLPWGAALALLMCLLAQLWAGLKSGSLLEPMLMGVTTFTVASIAYLWPGPDQLVVPYSPEAMALLPGPTLASVIWWLGTAAVTLISMVLVKWIIVRDRAASR